VRVDLKQRLNARVYECEVGAERILRIPEQIA
jgi:hypothetical protein